MTKVKNVLGFPSLTKNIQSVTISTIDDFELCQFDSLEVVRAFENVMALHELHPDHCDFLMQLTVHTHRHKYYLTLPLQ